MRSKRGKASVANEYDAILVVAFGGPEGREEVLPFLENVTRGRNVPRERLEQVAEHYDLFDGVSPLNDQVRELITALTIELDGSGLKLPIYWGNRNWHPFLSDTMQRMAEDGVERALALVLSAYSSYSSCRQYLENIEDARQAAGRRAPVVDKIRAFYNHPDFIAANAERVREAWDARPDPGGHPRLVYTAHSIPQSMAERCDYRRQLGETSRLVSRELSIEGDGWDLVFQSRSGPPHVPWLEPDVVDHLKQLYEQGCRDVIVAPIGFLSDHVEVLYDLDTEAQSACRDMGMKMVRAKTVGTHPRFVGMLRELIQERLHDGVERRSVGRYGPSHDVCPADCCPIR